MKNIILVVIIFLFLSTHIFGNQNQIEMKRLALVFGSNFGGNDRVTLQYAHTDAKAFARVLSELGGVKKEDLKLVLEPNIKTFQNSISELKKEAESSIPNYRRVEVILYYSGHSDEEGLLLGKEKFYYKDFKKQVTGIPADIRIAVLDACASGALTRLKGGKKSKAFLVDETTDMQGYAFLTSNSEDEVAQESDRIQGSYFTHNLNSGLRGAADMTNDGKVTLNEAYQYAFHETLVKTEKTQGGAQHAGYDIQISGSGEVVMTDLRSISSAIVLPENMEGKIYIRDSDEKLMAELQKFKGRSVSLGLEPGAYGITIEKKPSLLFSNITLIKGKEITIFEKNFKNISKEPTVSRGTRPLTTLENYDTVLVSYALLPPIHKKNGKNQFPKYYHKYSFNFIGGYYHKLEGVGLGLGFQWAEHSVDGAQFSILLNVVRGDLHGFQGTPLLNVANNVYGGQASGLINSALNVTGGQGAGLFNIAKKLEGGQGAGLFNIAMDVKGGQGAGLFNASGETYGFQAAGLFNVSGNHTGIQISGLFNIAKKINGLQIGVVNFAQEMNGETIGLINLNKKARFQPSIWYDEGGYSNIMLMTGHRIFYGNLNIGMLSDRDEKVAKNLTLSAGIGAHIIQSPVTLNMDVSQGQLWKREKLLKENGNQFMRLRFSLGIPILKFLNPTAGVSLNLMHHEDKELHYQNYLAAQKFSNGTWSYWTGFFAGISF